MKRPASAFRSVHNDSMEWRGKLVGAAVGFAVLGPAGSVLGALLGHQFDSGWGGFTRRAARIQRLFFEVTFEVMGRAAKADGRVSEAEIRMARRIMHGMRLAPEQVQAAIDRFTAGKRAAFPFTQRVGELAEAFGGRRDLARAFIELQLRAAIGSGELTPEKRQLLWQVAQQLKLDRAEFAQIEALVRNQGRAGEGRSGPTLEDAHRALGVEPSASDSEVKTAYRRLMNRHHPDKLVSQGLPESMIDLAERKTHEIRAAYERIKTERGFK